MIFDATTHHHAQKIYSHVDKKGLAEKLEAQIARSWERCLQSYRIDPEAPRKPLIIEHAELTDHRERIDELLGDFAKEEMAQLYQRILGSGYSVILTNSDGIIVSYVGDPTLTEYFNRSGLLPGAIWTEEKEGTNGIGTCLYEKSPVIVCREEHFRTSHTILTCSAAPVFDAQGELLAVLDVSSTSAQDSRESHRHTAALVNISARQIENFGFMRQCQSHWVLRFHPKPYYIGHFTEGLLAVDETGLIIAANQNALHHFNKTRGEIVGKNISDLLTTNLTLLTSYTNRQPNGLQIVYDVQHGHPFHTQLQFPQRRSSSIPNANIQRISSTQMPFCMSLEALAGKDPIMTFNVRHAQKVMNKSIPILLQGETGTGKEALAKAIHEASQRKHKPFVALNCAAIPEALIESELFGYKHGAFTGARREGMRGKILQSHGGTLFLDEIGDMPLTLQTRLLRVLEEKAVVPLGSEMPVAVELTVISATHHQLPKLIAEGKFREDLYYRLNGITLTLPPLRERNDIDTLIRCALAAENFDNESIEIEAEAFNLLVAYQWPGNIRQLRNVIRTALALRTGNLVTRHELPTDITYRTAVTLPDRTLVQLDNANIATTTATIPHITVPPVMHAQPTITDMPDLDAAEKNVILQALEHHRWNITNTAVSLKMSRNTLYRKMKKHAIALSNA
ncbi:transcriptional activator of acetoin/glycerol metabolism [Beggiatoa alba B18LD]|uniref:Transcriptional activator of acetoin/glycerol metabolism n=1 Tax=Beggiatoa alba B18LD TaxID=395493 RepID=I3CK11_9GAMM|nr:sigma-54-dependent Fis family transcriptional regulator [Beggiatoa alba]EIJ43954.1 transcriptional activator of acetoin/glycerol metabolism [Beggiatoa alba B18LD]